jgi:hypothetical protein
VLTAEGLVLQGPALREPAIRTPWPDWIEWKSGRVWYYDFTHFTPGASGSSSTLVSAEETSSQIEAAFLAASMYSSSPSVATPGCWLACVAVKRPSRAGRSRS